MTPDNRLGRTHLHRRVITLDGYARGDGLIEVEGEIKDVKTYDFPNRERGVVKAGEPLHHMRVRIALDHNLTIHEAEAETIAAPFAICPKATIGFSSLIGLVIGTGWKNKTRRAIGGITGCTHITELMGPVATVAIQTLYGEKARLKRESGNTEKPASANNSIADNSLADSCIGHAIDPDAALEKMIEENENAD